VNTRFAALGLTLALTILLSATDVASAQEAASAKQDTAQAVLARHLLVDLAERLAGEELPHQSDSVREGGAAAYRPSFIIGERPLALG